MADEVVSTVTHELLLAALDAAVLSAEETLSSCLMNVWYADATGHTHPDEFIVPEEYMESARKDITVHACERNAEARLACISHHAPYVRDVDSISKNPMASTGKAT